MSPRLAIPQHKSSSSETASSVAAGTITVRDGNADLTELKRNGTLDDQALKAIFDEKKVREQQALGIVAGQVGLTAVGDVSAYMYKHATTQEERAKWADGGQNKVLLHGLVGAASAVLGGGNAAAGAIGSGASEAASQAMAQYLVDHNIDPNLPEGRALMALASTALGGAAGGDSGAAGTLNGAKYNRELHVDEQAAIANLAATSNKKYTEEEVQAVACVMVKCVSGRGLTEPQSLADGLIGGSPTFTPASQELINQYNSVLSGMSEEKKQEIKAQLEATGLFGYGFGEALSDSWADAHGATRIEGLEKASQGFINAYVSATVCKFAPGACGPATFSVAKESDTFAAGVGQYWTGGATASVEEWGYQTAGLSQQNAAAAKPAYGCDRSGCDCAGGHGARECSTWDIELSRWRKLDLADLQRHS